MFKFTLASMLTFSDKDSTLGNKTNQLTFVLICLGVSVRNIDDVGSLPDILVCAPCSAGMKAE